MSCKVKAFAAPMSPLAFLPALLAVLVLCRSPLAIASISQPTLSLVACGGDQVTVLDASDGLLNLSVNGVLVHDRVLGCQKLRSYFGSGCLRCNQLSDVWGGVVKQYCSKGSSHGKLVLVTPKMRIIQLRFVQLANCNLTVVQ